MNFCTTTRKKIILKGLEINDFIHPLEKEKIDSFRSSCSEAIVNNLNEVCASIMMPYINGVYVQVTHQSHKHLYDLLIDVCTVLDYTEDFPTICITHNTITDVSPCGNEKQKYLIVPDYIIKRFDDDMMRYSFGNAITMIKAGHIKLSNIASFVPSFGVFDIVEKPFTDYFHAADMTSDRGGLLACQSFAAAAKCYLFELGVPINEINSLITTDEQAAVYVQGYIANHSKYKYALKNNLTKLGSIWKDTQYFEGAANEMLADLLDWYISDDGYKMLLNKYGRGE